MDSRSMTQYNNVNIKLSDSQLDQLKSATKNETRAYHQVWLIILNDEVNFPHKLLLTDRQVAHLCKGFENNLSANIKLLKTKLFKVIQLRGFLGKVLGPLMKVGLLLMKNMLQPLAKSVTILIPLELIKLIPLELTIAASAADAGVLFFFFFFFGLARSYDPRAISSGTTTLIISNEEIEDIMKILKSLEDSDILIKGVTKTIENETKEQRGRFLGLCLGALVTSLLENMLTGKGFIWAGDGATSP